MMGDRANFMEKEKEEREQESDRVLKEFLELKEFVEKDKDAKLDQDDAFKEEQEAYQLKMKIQIDQIEELTK